jgi:hypothetical protein
LLTEANGPSFEPVYSGRARVERKGVEFDLVNVDDLIVLKTAFNCSNRDGNRMARRTKVEPVVRMLPARPETFESLEGEMLEYSASLSYSEH